MAMGSADPVQMLSAERRLCGHDATGPTDVRVQSKARMRAPMSLLPTNGSGMARVTRAFAGGGEPEELPSCRKTYVFGTTFRLLRTDFTPSVALAIAAARVDPACDGTVPLSVATPLSTSTSMSLPFS